MTREEREQAIAILENEKKCVNRANKNDYCNRDCYNCELVKTDTEILTALDMAIKALQEQADNIPVMYYPQVDGITPTVVAQADGEKVFKMRDATPEEQEAVDKYIKSISKPTGVNIFDFYEDEDKSCDNCKHHLKFMCKKWETCHNYSDWELEELDFVQPHKTIPCKIKVADGEYILKKDVMGCIGQTSLHWELARKLRKLPSVAIPNKVGHWEYNQYDGNPNIGNWHCSECRNIVSDMPTCMGKPLYEFCPHCGSPMEIER